MNSSKTLLLQTEVGGPDGYSDIIFRLKTYISLQPACILMKGVLGAGKTTFIHYFCESYGLKNISSPTFALHQCYQNQMIKIDHFDLYRLQTSEEIETSGLWEVLSDLTNSLIFIEWPERISSLHLPQDRIIYEVEISKLDENKRRLTLSRLFS